MHSEGVYLEDLCFHAQQAVEKAIKALLIRCAIEFPYIHDIAGLLTLLEQASQHIPPAVRQAERLTRFAVFTRYPGIAAPVRHEEYQEAVSLAGEVVQWAEHRLLGDCEEPHQETATHECAQIQPSDEASPSAQPHTDPPATDIPMGYG
jgi:HEPN domain-containing protein